MSPLALLALGYLLTRKKSSVGAGQDWRRGIMRNIQRQMAQGMGPRYVGPFGPGGVVVTKGGRVVSTRLSPQPQGPSASTPSYQADRDYDQQGGQGSAPDYWKDPQKPGFVWRTQPNGHWERLRADGSNDPDSPNFQPDGDPTSMDQNSWNQQYGGVAYPGGGYGGPSYGGYYGGGYGGAPGYGDPYGYTGYGGGYPDDSYASAWGTMPDFGSDDVYQQWAAQWQQAWGPAGDF